MSRKWSMRTLLVKGQPSFHRSPNHQTTRSGQLLSRTTVVVRGRGYTSCSSASSSPSFQMLAIPSTPRQESGFLNPSPVSATIFGTIRHQWILMGLSDIDTALCKYYKSTIPTTVVLTILSHIGVLYLPLNVVWLSSVFFFIIGSSPTTDTTLLPTVIADVVPQEVRFVGFHPGSLQ